jgi:hypothetical protein
MNDLSDHCFPPESIELGASLPFNSSVASLGN